MAVVSNTSPLTYLLLIGEIEVLRALYGRIHVPSAVLAELISADSPLVLQTWGRSPPGWIVVQDPTVIHTGPALHVGETHAISLALELGAERLVMDERAGRAAARLLGVPLVGTLGVLDFAAERGLVDLPRALKRLAGTNFRIAQKLIEEVLRRDANRTSKGGVP